MTPSGIGLTESALTPAVNPWEPPGCANKAIRPLSHIPISNRSIKKSVAKLFDCNQYSFFVVVVNLYSNLRQSSISIIFTFIESLLNACPSCEGWIRHLSKLLPWWWRWWCVFRWPLWVVASRQKQNTKKNRKEIQTRHNIYYISAYREACANIELMRRQPHPLSGGGCSDCRCPTLTDQRNALESHPPADGDEHSLELASISIYITSVRFSWGHPVLA